MSESKSNSKAQCRVKFSNPPKMSHISPLVNALLLNYSLELSALLNQPKALKESNTLDL